MRRKWKYVLWLKECLKPLSSFLPSLKHLKGSFFATTTQSTTFFTFGLRYRTCSARQKRSRGVQYISAVCWVQICIIYLQNINVFMLRLMYCIQYRDWNFKSTPQEKSTALFSFHHKNPTGHPNLQQAGSKWQSYYYSTCLSPNTLPPCLMHGPRGHGSSSGKMSCISMDSHEGHMWLSKPQGNFRQVISV